MNSETAKIKAKSKLILWWTLLLCVALVGGAWEYLHQTQPLDQTTLIFKPGSEGGEVVNQVPAEEAAVQTEAETTENTESQKIEENSPKEEIPVAEEPEAEFEDLQEFLMYMQELQQQIEEDVEHVSVLDRIKQEEIVQPVEKPQQAVVFDENKIEVYDSEKGVVGVIDVAEQKAEKTLPLPEVLTMPETVETAPIENNAVVAGGAEMIENAEQEMMDLAEKAQIAATEAENIVRENVQAEINRVEESGDEMPIILIPGLQNM